MRVLPTIPVLLLMLSHATSGALWAADPPASGLKHVRLYVIASDSFFATVNQGDATASMSIWIKQLGMIRGFQVESRMEIAQSIGQFRQRLKEHSVDLLVLDTPDYLSLADSGLVEAVAVGTSRGQLAAYPYLLLTNDAGGAGQLAGLRGKRIMVASRTKSNMGLIWLETLLAENRLSRAAGFFGSVQLGYRASSCVLPLFFGKIDACVVDSGNFDAVKELNPQLGRLRILAHSETVLEGLIAMPMEPHPYRREVLDSILTLHKNLAGEQLGIIFKVGQQIPASSAMFDSAAALCTRYRRLLKAPGDGLEPVAGQLEAVKERP
jgi:phosphonate transport system substrate-binding protein